jgi:hypothetical protein
MHEKVDYLVVIRSQLVQAFLDHMIAVQVLDQHDDVKTEGNNDRMDLSRAMWVRLFTFVSENSKRLMRELACRPVDKKSIIF